MSSAGTDMYFDLLFGVWSGSLSFDTATRLSVSSGFLCNLLLQSIWFCGIYFTTKTLFVHCCAPSIRKKIKKFLSSPLSTQSLCHTISPMRVGVWLWDRSRSPTKTSPHSCLLDRNSRPRQTTSLRCPKWQSLSLSHFLGTTTERADSSQRWWRLERKTSLTLCLSNSADVGCIENNNKPRHHTDEMHASASIAFCLVTTLTFDLWPWKLFQPCPVTCWIFVQIVIEIPALSTELSPCAKQVFTDDRRTPQWWPDGIHKTLLPAWIFRCRRPKISL